MVTATIFAGLLALPMACVYAYFASAMPRSGGDYVYISRTLHPYLGFLSSWNWMVWLVTYTGIPAAYLAQYGLSGLCREAGFVLEQPAARLLRRQLHPQVVDLRRGDDPAHRLRDHLLARDAALLPHPERVVRDRDGRRGGRHRHPRRQGPRRDATSGFNAYVSGLGGSHDAVAAAAKSSGNLQQAGFDLKQTLYAMVWPLFITLYAITSSFIGGEVRNAKRSAVPGHAGIDRLRHDPDAPARARPRPRGRHDVPRPARRRRPGALGHRLDARPTTS